MVVRVDRAIFDPTGQGSTAGGLRVFDDGTRNPPWQDRPGQSKEQYIVSEALRLMTIPRDQIRAMQAAPPYALNPPIYGYDTTPLGIRDILDTNRWEPTRRSWTSGIVGKPRHSDVDNDLMSATSRNISSTSPGG
jgi:hypothetical protein